MSARYDLASPGGRLAVSIWIARPDGTLWYEVSYDGQPMVAPTRLGLCTDLADFSEWLTCATTETSRIDEHYTLPSGKRLDYRGCANQLSLQLRRGHAQIELTVRAYDEAAAYRFTVAGTGALSVHTELGGHNLPPAHAGWAAELAPDYERRWQPRSAAELACGTWQYPVLIRTAQGVWALLTEAAVYAEYVGSHAKGHARGLALTPFALPVHTRRPFCTPWRVTLAGRELAPIVQSSVIEHLNPATELRDLSFIRPGRAAWSWWSGDSTSDYATQVAYVDFAAAQGWEHVLCDEGWREDWMPRLVQYARARRVGIWLWRDAQYLSSQAERERQLQQWAGWGVAGVKVDFVYGDGMPQLALYDALARAAAEQRLMLNFHGCTKPAGERRRWPHVLTREAVHGAEHYKFAGGPTAAFNCIVPFTRNVQGPMDYTPVTYSSHRGNTTLAHQTALAIVFESGVQHLADRHGVYERSVARELLAACPAVWDETRLLEGEPGRFVSLARRRGRAWFVGAITGDAARRLVLPLSFLDEGTYVAEICRDGAGDSDQVCEYRRVTARSTLEVALLPRGGCAVHCRPA